MRIIVDEGDIFNSFDGGLAELHINSTYCFEASILMQIRQNSFKSRKNKLDKDLDGHIYFFSPGWLASVHLVQANIPVLRCSFSFSSVCLSVRVREWVWRPGEQSAEARGVFMVYFWPQQQKRGSC